MVPTIPPAAAMLGPASMSWPEATVASPFDIDVGNSIRNCRSSSLSGPCTGAHGVNSQASFAPTLTLPLVYLEHPNHSEQQPESYDEDMGLDFIQVAFPPPTIRQPSRLGIPQKRAHEAVELPGCAVFDWRNQMIGSRPIEHAKKRRRKKNFGLGACGEKIVAACVRCRKLKKAVRSIATYEFSG